MTINEAKQLGESEIRRRFATHLRSQGLAESTVNTSCTDAFYLLRNDQSLDFWALLLAVNFEELARMRLDATLHQFSVGKIQRNINNYLFHLRTLRHFVLGEVLPATRQEWQSHPRTPIRRRRREIPYPTKAEVIRYLEHWETLADYREQESALDKLFLKLAPRNVDISDVLLKAAALNDFYSTNIFSTYPVAGHIMSLNIDDRLVQGDLSLVDDLQNVDINGKTKKLYSFATKYCSHHQPGVYPIYDNYVDHLLCYFRDTESFMMFSKNDLRIYGRFVEVLRNFRQYFALEGFTLKELDRYLWLCGRDHFGRNYRKAKKISG